MGTITLGVQQYWPLILIMLAIISIFFFLGWQRTKELLYQLMLQAKRMAKETILKSGQAQEDWVVKNALYYMPIRIKFFISEDMTRKIVRWLYQKAKDYADDEVLNDSIKG